MKPDFKSVGDVLRSRLRRRFATRQTLATATAAAGRGGGCFEPFDSDEPSAALGVGFVAQQKATTGVRRPPSPLHALPVLSPPPPRYGHRMALTPEQRDRGKAVLLATAAGDALGAGYEFGPPLDPDMEVSMRGGGHFGWEPGEWTDDTSMAIAIAEVASRGVDLRTDWTQDQIVGRWVEWAQSATDVGIQTRRVLYALSGGDAAGARDVAAEFHEQSGLTAGNGAPMRTAPVALAYLADPEGLSEAAVGIAKLTHFDKTNGEACVLWCHAIRHAVLTGTLDVRVGLGQLPAEVRDSWAEWLGQAERSRPRDFGNNGWVVEALQGAWSAIATTPVPAEDRAGHLRMALEAAVRGGNDTDTVAAIAGGLLGAAYGVAAVPSEWQPLLHGWPDLHGPDLITLAEQIIDNSPALS